jgi:hypothetical protein
MKRVRNPDLKDLVAPGRECRQQSEACLQGGSGAEARLLLQVEVGGGARRSTFQGGCVEGGKLGVLKASGCWDLAAWQKHWISSRGS